MPNTIDNSKVIKIRVKDADFEHKYDHQGYNRMTALEKNRSIYGDNDKINAEEVKKGKGGDHWLTTILYEFARTNPNAIHNMIKDNQDGTVTVRFYKTLKNGQKCPLDVIVDKSLPEVPGSNIHAPWIGLIEKAYAAGFNRTIMAEEQGEMVQVETGRFQPNMKFILQPGSPEEFMSALFPDHMISTDMNKTLIDDIDTNEQKTSEIRRTMAGTIAGRINLALQVNNLVYAKTKDNVFPIVGFDEVNDAFSVYDFKTGNTITYPVSDFMERKAGKINPPPFIESIEIIQPDPSGVDRPTFESFNIAQIRTMAPKLTAPTSRDPELFARITADFLSDKLREIYNNLDPSKKPTSVEFNQAMNYLLSAQGKDLLKELAGVREFRDLTFQTYITHLRDISAKTEQQLMSAFYEVLRQRRNLGKQPELEPLFEVLFNDMNEDPGREQNQIAQSKSERYPDIQYEDTDPVIVKEQDAEKSDAFLNTFMDALKMYQSVLESISTNLDKVTIHEGLQDISSFAWKENPDPAVYQEYKDMDLPSFRDIYENFLDHSRMNHFEHVEPGQKGNTKKVRDLLADIKEKAEQYAIWAKPGTHSDRLEELLLKYKSLEELFDTRTSADLTFLKNKMKLSFLDYPAEEEAPEEEPVNAAKEEPVNAAKEEPVHVAKEEPVHVAKEEPVNVAQEEEKPSEDEKRHDQEVEQFRQWEEKTRAEEREYARRKEQESKKSDNKEQNPEEENKEKTGNDLITWDEVNRQIETMEEQLKEISSSYEEDQKIDGDFFARWKLYHDLRDMGKEAFEAAGCTHEKLENDIKNLQNKDEASRLFFFGLNNIRATNMQDVEENYDQIGNLGDDLNLFDDFEENGEELYELYQTITAGRDGANLSPLEAIFEDKQVPEDMNIDELFKNVVKYLLLKEFAAHQAEFDRYKAGLDAAKSQEEEEKKQEAEEKSQEEEEKSSEEEEKSREGEDKSSEEEEKSREEEEKSQEAEFQEEDQEENQEENQEEIPAANQEEIPAANQNAAGNKLRFTDVDEGLGQGERYTDVDMDGNDLKESGIQENHAESERESVSVEEKKDADEPQKDNDADRESQNSLGSEDNQNLAEDQKENQKAEAEPAAEAPEAEEDEEPVQEAASDNKTAILRGIDALNAEIEQLQDTELPDPKDGQMKKMKDLAAFKQFRSGLSNLVKETDKYYTMDEEGNYHPLDGDGLYKLLKLYEEVYEQTGVLRTALKKAEKSLPGNEAVAVYDKLLQSTRRLLRTDIRTLTGISTNQSVILPDVIMDKRARHLEIKDQIKKEDTVGDHFSVRIPITYTDENNIVHNGFFTEDQSVDFKTTVRKEIAEFLATMGRRAKSNKEVLALFEHYFNTVFSVPEIADNPERLRKAILDCGKNIMDNGAAMAAECKNKNINWNIFGKNEAERNEEEKNRKAVYDQFVQNDPGRFQRLGERIAESLLNTRKIAEFLGLHDWRDVQISRVNGTSIAQRNSAMSAVANLLGIGNLIAHSENMKVTIDGKEISGVFMENGEGEDLAKAEPGGFLDQSVADGMTVSATTDVKNDLFSLQVLDYICNNVDRHQNNVLYKVVVDQDKKETKIVGLQGIDNDLSFGTQVPDPDVLPVGNELTIKDLGYIPAKLARAVLALNPGVLDLTLKGFNISEEERKSCLKRLDQIKNALYDRIKVVDEAGMQKVSLIDFYNKEVSEKQDDNGEMRKINSLTGLIGDFRWLVNASIQANEMKKQASGVKPKNSFKEASYQNSAEVSEREKAAHIMTEFTGLLKKEQVALNGYLDSALWDHLQNSAADVSFKAVREAIERAGKEAQAAEKNASASVISVPGLYSANYIAALNHLKEQADAYLASVRSNGAPEGIDRDRIGYVEDLRSFVREELDNMDRIHKASDARQADGNQKNRITWETVNKQLAKMPDANNNREVDVRFFLRWKLYRDISKAGKENFDRIRYSLEEMNVDARNLMRSGPAERIFFDSFAKFKNVRFGDAKKCFEMVDQFKNYAAMLSDVKSNVAALSDFYDKLQENQNLDELKNIFEGGKIPEGFSFTELVSKRLDYWMLSELTKHQAEFENYKKEQKENQKAEEEKVVINPEENQKPEEEKVDVNPDENQKAEEEKVDVNPEENQKIEEEKVDVNPEENQKPVEKQEERRSASIHNQMKEKDDDIIELADRHDSQNNLILNANPRNRKQLEEQINPEGDNTITNEMLLIYRNYIGFIGKTRDWLVENEGNFFIGKTEYNQLKDTLNEAAKTLTRIYNDEKSHKNIGKEQMENSIRAYLEAISKAGDRYMEKHNDTKFLSSTQSKRLEAISQLQLAAKLFGEDNDHPPVSIVSEEATVRMIASKLISSLAKRSLKIGLGKEIKDKDGHVTTDMTYYHKLQSDKTERDEAIRKLLKEPEFKNMIRELKQRNKLFDYAYLKKSDKILNYYDDDRWAVKKPAEIKEDNKRTIHELKK